MTTQDFPSLYEQVDRVRIRCNVPDHIKIWHQDQCDHHSVTRVFFIRLPEEPDSFDGFPATKTIARWEMNFKDSML